MSAPTTKGPKHRLLRRVDGKIVHACLYNGKALGHGKYFAAYVDDQFVLDEQGRPLPLHAVGSIS